MNAILHNIGLLLGSVHLVIMKVFIAILLIILKLFFSKLDGVYKCLNEEIGKPCGDEALQFTTSFTNALSSFTKGFCIEINGTSFIKLQWNVLLGLLVALMIWYKY